MRYLIIPMEPQITVSNGRRYGFTNFVGDAFMTCLTGGIWLVWVIIREVRRP